MFKSRFLTGLTLATASLMFAIPAQAQFATNSKAPIKGSADNVDYRQDVTVLSGQVDIRQDDVRILSDTMKIYSGGGSGAAAFDDVRKIEAIGNFYYITPDQEVRGEQGVYCLLYTSPSPRDATLSRMPSSA